MSSNEERLAVVETKMIALQGDMTEVLTSVKGLEKKANYWTGGLGMALGFGGLIGWIVANFKEVFLGGHA